MLACHYYSVFQSPHFFLKMLINSSFNNDQKRTLNDFWCIHVTVEIG